MRESIEKKRDERQDAIRKIVRDLDIRTQHMLVEELRQRGFECTQATASRDIADLGLRKLPEGIYVLAEDLHLQRMVSELLTRVLRSDSMVILKAQPGTAAGIAAAIDAAEIPLVMASIAGDDTVLIITDGSQSAQRLESYISKLCNRG
ncbi:transcriptional regulator, ArgR family [Coriobacterium glomerans PW2]|uniref:Arginine repressor n=1 Tax=Coriobacterium glomerans (strain ATCC 49209 / DSM 20642 / JCM 10262 / PW2) TaxID=700015 RepID=F2N8L3_CORGP|nr:transcriptional regulator, ArgR family [Coriobacterium glomerans PW2]